MREEIMGFMTELSFPALLAALVGLTNILTEVTKRVLAVKKAEWIVLLWAEGLSLTAMLLRSTPMGPVGWALAAAEGLVWGGVTAYAAMFGYDALYERVPETLRALVGYLNGGTGDAEQP